jgi:hypothetical protein
LIVFFLLQPLSSLPQLPLLLLLLLLAAVTIATSDSLSLLLSPAISATAVVAVSLLPPQLLVFS